MIERAELHDAASKAFGNGELRPDRDASWKLIAEMGWLMMPLPEDAGGLGLGADSTAAIHFELGKVLSRAPLLPALPVIGALAGKPEWAEPAIGGEFITASLLGGRLASSDSHLSGTLAGVADADMAQHVLVFTDDLAALAPVAQAQVRERPTWDESRRLFDVTFEGVEIDQALVLARGNEIAALADQFERDLLLGLAADSLGGATAALELTVEYLKTRRQFDRPLAMFQALQHRCADLRVKLGAAEALLWSRSANENASLAEIGALKALACDVYQAVTEEAIQLHGGIGLTDEYPIHLFMKRAMLNLMLGRTGEALKEAAGREVLAKLAA